jgi:hypothetical protein
MRGMVTNGPTPHICVMFTVVAWNRPRRRSNAGAVGLAMNVLRSRGRHGDAIPMDDVLPSKVRESP